MMSKYLDLQRQKMFILFISICCFPIPLVAATFSTITTVSGPGGDQAVYGGLGWIDFDNDGWQDLYIASRFGGNKLYRNLGDPDQNGIHNGFSLITNANIELTGKFSAGIAIGDFNSDGWDDIFVANADGHANSLLKNNGNGTFSDVSTIMGIANELSGGAGAVFGDVDGDGDLDLYVSVWSGGAANYFYRNLGGESGFARDDNVLSNAFKATFATLMTDFDNDNDLDVYTINDFLWGNDLQKNNGSGSFSVVSNGADIQLQGMGGSIGDYDNDGDLDYYVTDISSAGGINENILLRNLHSQGSDSFQDVTQAARVHGNERLVASQCSVYWGTAFLDVNNDGWLDLYAANDNRGFSGCPQSGIPVQNRLYINDANGQSFTEDLTSGTNITPGLGVATADFDNDGLMDLAVHGVGGEVRLMRNTTITSNKWVNFRLKGSKSNPRAIGAKVRMTTKGSNGALTQMREVSAGSSHGSTNSFDVHFGLPAGHTFFELTVEWPENNLTPVVLDELRLNRTHIISNKTGTIYGLSNLESTTHSVELNNGDVYTFKSSGNILLYWSLKVSRDFGNMVTLVDDNENGDLEALIVRNRRGVFIGDTQTVTDSLRSVTNNTVVTENTNQTFSFKSYGPFRYTLEAALNWGRPVTLVDYGNDSEIDEIIVENRRPL